jgi:hypothetical protein
MVNYKVQKSKVTYFFRQRVYYSTFASAATLSRPSSSSLDPCKSYSLSLFAWLISHQPAILFSQNKPATSNQPAVLFSQNKPAPAISYQLTEHVVGFLPCALWPGSGNPARRPCKAICHRFRLIVANMFVKPTNSLGDI